MMHRRSEGKGRIKSDGYHYSSDFYRDLHEMVDTSPSSFISTTHIFYVRNGQRNALDILENGVSHGFDCFDVFIKFINYGPLLVSFP